jgi:tetratricopeptide (TPR) repeat protein
VTVAEVGKALNVATVLEGSVRKVGNRARISVQLVKVSDSYHLWSEIYDRTLDDIFAVQDDIAQSVVKELRAMLTGEAPDSKAGGQAKADVAAAAIGRGQSAEAHRLYLQGRYFIDRLTREDTARGIGYLQEALALDPGHALAWTELSRARENEAELGWVSSTEGYGAARDAVERALALEPNLAEAHAALGSLQINHDRDWKGAQISYRRALELSPGNALVLREAGIMARDFGRLEEAIGLLRRAVEQDPLSSSSYTSLGLAYDAAELLSEAERAIRKGRELAPHRSLNQFLLALVLLRQGRPDEARVEAEREPEEAYRLTALSIIDHAEGRQAESDEELRQLVENHADEMAYQIAQVHASRREPDAAFEWLDRAYTQGDPGLSYMKPEPLFRSLHGDPRWNAFLERMGLAE